VRGFDWHAMWAPQWPPWEVVLRATIIYFFTAALFRLVGRKELSRYATHDIVLLFLVATATRESMVGKDTSLTSAMIALGTIVAWDTLGSWLSYRSRRMARVIDGKIRRLVKDGAVDEAEMRRARVSHDELLALLRRHGHTDLGRVRDAFFERTGRVTFVMDDSA
jgi:uncharacterized membrane protein YcaP (DUF421 family)